MMKALLGRLMPELVTMNPGSRLEGCATAMETDGAVAKLPVVGSA